MRFIYCYCILLTISACAYNEGDSLTSAQVLKKAIRYHDPQGNWKTFEGILHLYQIRADNSKRRDYVEFNNKESKVLHQRHLGDTILFRSFSDRECKINLRVQNSDISDPDLLEKYGLNCERAKMYRDYYTYLYGLPMKLRDRGTIIDPEVKAEKFAGKQCLQIRVTYEKEIGGDTWYFYFDPGDYHLCGYRFYHDESKQDGEFIICSEEIEVSGIRMPKNRSWYKHQKNEYLATDIIESVTNL